MEPESLTRLPAVSMHERVLTTRNYVADLFAAAAMDPDGSVSLRASASASFGSRRRPDLATHASPTVGLRSLQTDVVAALQRLADGAEDFDRLSLQRAIGGAGSGGGSTLAQDVGRYAVGAGDKLIVAVEERRIVGLHREVLDLRNRLERAEHERDAEQALCERKNELLTYIRETLWKEVVMLREQLFFSTKNPSYIAPDVLSLLDYVPLLQSRGDETNASALVTLEAELADMRKRHVAELAKQQGHYAEQMRHRDIELGKTKSALIEAQRNADLLAMQRTETKAGLTDQVRTLQAEVLQRDDRVRGLTAQLEELKGDIAGQQTVITGYKEQLQRVNTSVNKLLEDKDRELVLKSQKLSDAEQRAKAADALRQQLTAALQRADAAGRSSHQYEEEVAALAQQVAALVRERDDAREQATQAAAVAAQAKLVGASGSLDTAQQLVTLRRSVTNLESSLAEAKRVALATDMERKRLSEQLREAQLSTSRFEEELQSAMQMNSEVSRLIPSTPSAQFGSPLRRGSSTFLAKDASGGRNNVRSPSPLLAIPERTPRGEA
jgi:hypothetical protein